MTKTSLLLLLIFLPLAALGTWYAISTGALSGAVSQLSDAELERSLSGEIEITTNKPAYERAELVYITVQNPLQQDVLTHFDSLTPVVAIERLQRKGPDGRWQSLSAFCRYPHCTYTEDSPRAIAPGKKATFKWVPAVFLNGSKVKQQPEPGIYRIILRYQRTKGDEMQDWQLAASKEFELR